MVSKELEEKTREIAKYFFEQLKVLLDNDKSLTDADVGRIMDEELDKNQGAHILGKTFVLEELAKIGRHPYGKSNKDN